MGTSYRINVALLIVNKRYKYLPNVWGKLYQYMKKNKTRSLCITICKGNLDISICAKKTIKLLENINYVRSRDRKDLKNQSVTEWEKIYKMSKTNNRSLSRLYMDSCNSMKKRQKL